MNVMLKAEIQKIQVDLVMLEGMIEALIESAYAETNPALIGNVLEIMKEFLEARADRMEDIAAGMG